MKEKPIIMSTAMVKPILEGRKTQTRRPMKPQPSEVFWEGDHYESHWYDKAGVHHFCNDLLSHCPYGQVGGKLWVKETFCEHSTQGIVYKADFPDSPLLWRPSIHIPRWASRITLEIVKVRVERLREIMVEECVAEGYPLGAMEDSLNLKQIEIDIASRIGWYRTLWDSLNAKHPWASNCWVWVLEFRRIQEGKA